MTGQIIDNKTVDQDYTEGGANASMKADMLQLNENSNHLSDASIVKDLESTQGGYKVGRNTNV